MRRRKFKALLGASEASPLAALAQQPMPVIGYLVVAGDPFFTSQRAQIIALAARDAVPAIYIYRAFAAAGGLMSYGTDLADSYRQAGIYTGKILKSAKPTDLPVIQPTRFELVINLKAAKALNLTIPPGVYAIADEIIE